MRTAVSHVSSSPHDPPGVVVGMTGASGALYAVRLVEVLLAAGCQVQLSISAAGAAVVRQELGLDVDLDARRFRPESLLPPEGVWQKFAHLAGGRDHRAGVPAASGVHAGRGRLQYFHHQDLLAPMASGSARSAGMVVCPCSGGTLSAVAHAASGNLIQRAAEVHLKERRKLVLVPREAPLSLVHIENMRRATEAGAVVLPASPGFYHGVRSVADLVDFVVARICDQLAVEHHLMPRWGEAAEESADR
jgi:4-hydroxy-3-polyprenylbenzoate decarboxylase